MDGCIGFFCSSFFVSCQCDCRFVRLQLLGDGDVERRKEKGRKKKGGGGNVVSCRFWV